MKPDLIDSELRAAMFAVDQEQLYIHLAWCVWHEEVRLFDDSFPGAQMPLNGDKGVRSLCIEKQGHNGYARNLIENSSNNELQAVLSRIPQRVESERQLSTHFRWVAYHESQRRTILDLADQGDFFKIRDLYHTFQNHNPNARGLLSCISNYQLKQLIDAI